MARIRKDGKRATGIQGKHGKLYVLVPTRYTENEKTVVKKRWHPTNLPDRPENIKRASEIRLELQAQKRELLLNPNITVSEFIENWLQKKKREIADTTYATYCYRAKHITDYFGDTKLKEVKVSMLELFLDSLFIEFKLQPRTAKDIKTTLADIREQAVKDGIRVDNPMRNVSLNKSLSDSCRKSKNVDDTFFSYAEAQVFLKIVENHELYFLFYFTLVLGLRREEALGLRWSSINWTKNELYINHTVTIGTKINRLNTTKTESSSRTYPLSEGFRELLLRMKKMEEEYRILFGEDYKENDYVFKHPDGSLYYPDYPSKVFKKIIKSHPELPQAMTFHGLRTSCVSILVYNGNDVESIRKWVGHKDLETTLRIYTRVKDKCKEEISVSMSNLLPISIII